MSSELIILLVMTALIVCGTIALVRYIKSNKYLERLRQKKRKEVEPHMNSIRSINDTMIKTNSYIQSKSDSKDILSKMKDSTQRTLAKGKLVLKERKEYRADFEKHKTAYQEYVEFCNSHNFTLTDEESYFIDYMDETEDLLYPEKALDRQLERTYKKYDEAYALMVSSGEQLLELRNISAQIIDKVTEYINSIAKHPKEFDVSISEIIVNRDSFKQALE